MPPTATPGMSVSKGKQRRDSLAPAGSGPGPSSLNAAQSTPPVAAPEQSAPPLATSESDANAAADEADELPLLGMDFVNWPRIPEQTDPNVYYGEAVQRAVSWIHSSMISFKLMDSQFYDDREGRSDRERGVLSHVGRIEETDEGVAGPRCIFCTGLNVECKRYTPELRAEHLRLPRGCARCTYVKRFNNRLLVGKPCFK